MRRVQAAVLAVVAASSVAGCARKQIDVGTTGSVKVEGTNWYRFCDGPNAVMWTKGLGGDSDEIEAYVYDHWACTDRAVSGPRSTDPDGLVDDDED